MAYYSDTTKRLLGQIGRPYEYSASQGIDLSSLLMALMFMPQKGKTVLGQTPLPAGKGLPGGLDAMSAAPNVLSMIPPEIFSAILGLPGLGGII